MTKDVKTAEEVLTLAEAVKKMREINIGCLVVVKAAAEEAGDGKRQKEDVSPVGIFTERDLVRKIAESGASILSTPMAQLMSKPLTTISPGATIWDAIAVMGRLGIRRLPVVDGGRLIGLLTETDVFRLIVSQQNLLLESVSESFPTATMEQMRGIAGQFGLQVPPGRTSRARSSMSAT
jgi:CBS domain-containing protein